MSFTDFANYKHDITGKFRDINSVVSVLAEENFHNPDNLEVLHAVHEVLLRMILTSRKALTGLNLKIDLIVSHEKAKSEFPILSLGSTLIRIENTSSGIRYWLFLTENPRGGGLDLEMIKTLLPVSEIIFENGDSQK